MNENDVVLEDSKYEFLYDYLQTINFYECKFKSIRTVTVSGTSNVVLSSLDAPVTSDFKLDGCAVAAKVSALSSSTQVVKDTDDYIVNKVNILNQDGSPVTINGDIVYGLLQMLDSKDDNTDVNNDVQITFVTGLTPAQVTLTGTFLFNYTQCYRLTRRNSLQHEYKHEQYVQNGLAQYESYLQFPSVGKTGIIYVDVTNKDSYFWNPIRSQFEICGSDYSAINRIDCGNSSTNY